MPSMTYSGWFPADSDDEPRTRTEIPLPGLPAFWMTCSPAAFPCSAASTLATGTLTRSSLRTVVTALVTSRRLAVPYPTTTTCERLSAAARNVKSATEVSSAATVTLRCAGPKPRRVARTEYVPTGTLRIT